MPGISLSEEKKPFRQAILALVAVYLSSYLTVVFAKCCFTGSLEASLLWIVAFGSLIWTLLLAVPVAIIAGRTPWNKAMATIAIIAAMNGCIAYCLVLGVFIWLMQDVVI